ncbi:MAG: pilin [Candidatus Paceibacterota bacterium]
MKKTIARITAASTFFLPVVALAQFGEVDTFVGNITTFINNVIIPLIFAIALVVFIWGIFKLFIHKNAEEAEQGKKLALYAIVGFVLMVSIWGIVNVVASGLGLSGKPLENIPTTPTR